MIVSILKAVTAALLLAAGATMLFVSVNDTIPRDGGVFIGLFFLLVSVPLLPWLKPR